MELDIQTVEKLAHLARLDIKPEEKPTVIKDLNRILSFVEKLNELDTTNVEPLIYMVDEVNILRDDIPRIDITQKEALMNAPKKDSDYFKVPKMIDKEEK